MVRRNMALEQALINHHIAAGDGGSPAAASGWGCAVCCFRAAGFVFSGSRIDHSDGISWGLSRVDT